MNDTQFGTPDNGLQLRWEDCGFTFVPEVSVESHHRRGWWLSPNWSRPDLRWRLFWGSADRARKHAEREIRRKKAAMVRAEMQRRAKQSFTVR